VNLAVAGGVHQPQIREVLCAPMLLGKHMVHMQRLAVFEHLETDVAAALLPIGKLPKAIRQGLGAAPPLSPVVLKGRVVGGIGLGDEPMPYNPCPGEFPERGMALLILKDPAVSPGSQGPAPILLGSPPAGFTRVASLHVALSAGEHEGVQFPEHPGGHPDAEVLTPAADQSAACSCCASSGAPGNAGY
jgi:hypothetical protein